MSFKSGLIAVVGHPNVGKSSLINAIMGKKLAIVSDRAQTTRSSLVAIYNSDESQLVFFDTPGIHQPKDAYGRFLNKIAMASLEGVDLIFFVVAADQFMRAKDKEILDLVLKQKESTSKLYLIINKIDMVKKVELIQQLIEAENMGVFDELIPVSAKTGDNISTLLEVSTQAMTNDLPFYDDQQMTTQSSKFLMAELIREQVLIYTHQEIPHHTKVEIEHIDYPKIFASIIVSSKSHKPILIGKQGSMVKKIRLAALKSIRNIFGKEIQLEIYIKVAPDWRKQAKDINEEL